MALRTVSLVVARLKGKESAASISDGVYSAAGDAVAETASVSFSSSSPSPAAFGLDVDGRFGRAAGVRSIWVSSSTLAAKRTRRRWACQGVRSNPLRHAARMASSSGNVCKVKEVSSKVARAWWVGIHNRSARHEGDELGVEFFVSRTRSKARKPVRCSLPRCFRAGVALPYPSTRAGASCTNLELLGPEWLIPSTGRGC